MSKGLKITIISISIFLFLVLSTIGVYFLWPWNRHFFNEASEEFAIPGLDTEFVPQGMTISTMLNKYIISGYMNDGSPSRFYVINPETKEVEKYFTLKNGEDDYIGHAGGIANYGSTFWVVSNENGNGFGFRFLFNDVYNVKNGESINIIDYFNTYNNADFAFVQDKTLWVGEFYKKGKYETDSYHHLHTTSGETNHAIVYGFRIDEACQYSLYDTKPEKALSIRDLCQGMAVSKEGKIVISTSYSIADSHIYYYKDVFSESPKGHTTYKIGFGVVVPLWYLDNNSLIKDVKIPAMSEEIVILNDRVYILFESASKKYRLFNRNRLDHVYSLPLNFFEK